MGLAWAVQSVVPDEVVRPAEQAVLDEVEWLVEQVGQLARLVAIVVQAPMALIADITV